MSANAGPGPDKASSRVTETNKQAASYHVGNDLSATEHDTQTGYSASQAPAYGPQSQQQDQQQQPFQWSSFPGSVNVQAANGYSPTGMTSPTGYYTSPLYSPYGQPLLDPRTAGSYYRVDPSNSSTAPATNAGYTTIPSVGYMGMPSTSGTTTSQGTTFYGYPATSPLNYNMAMNPYAYHNYGAGMGAAMAGGYGLMNRRNSWVPPSTYQQQQGASGGEQSASSGKEMAWRNTSGAADDKNNKQLETSLQQQQQQQQQQQSGGRVLKKYASYHTLPQATLPGYTDAYTTLATQQTAALALAKVAQEAAAQQSAKYGHPLSTPASPLFPHSPGLANFGQTISPESLPPEVLAILQNGPPVPPPVPSLFTAPNVEDALDSSLQNPNRTTNVYIRGLPPDTTDAGLLQICERFGPISSSKAILDAATDTCKGFGFACFVNELDAQTCISALTHVGYQVSFAKESFSVRLKNLQDPSSTNLYLSNLPLNMKEDDLEELFEPYKIDSCRILRDVNNLSRGVGFARMDSRQGAEEIIAKFDGKSLSGEGSSGLPLQVRFADSPSQKRLKGQTQRRRQWRAREYNILTGRAGLEEMTGYMMPPAAAAGGAAQPYGLMDPAAAAASRLQLGLQGDTAAAESSGARYSYDAGAYGDPVTGTSSGTTTGGAAGETGYGDGASAEPRTMPDKQAEMYAKAADQAQLAAAAGDSGGGSARAQSLTPTMGFHIAKGGDDEEDRLSQEFAGGRGRGGEEGSVSYEDLVEGVAQGMQQLKA